MLRELAAVLSFLPAILARTTYESPPVSAASGRGTVPVGTAPVPPRGPHRWRRRREAEPAGAATGGPAPAHDESTAGPTFAIPMLQSQSLRWTPMRVVLIVLVAAFHVLLMAVLTVAQYWSLETVPEPPIQVSFFSVVQPPPPPPPPPRRAPAAPAAVKALPVEAPKVVVQPVAIPERAPEPAAVDPNAGIEGVEGGVEGGVPGGVVGGLPGGVVGGVPGGVPGPAPPPPVEEILRVGGNVEKPVLLHSVNPRYPELARKARLSGVVVVEAVIDRNGNVVNPRVVKPMPLGLSEAALEAVRQWRYKPATMNGRPVSVFFTLTVNFRVV